MFNLWFSEKFCLNFVSSKLDFFSYVICLLSYAMRTFTLGLGFPVLFKGSSKFSRYFHDKQGKLMTN